MAAVPTPLTTTFTPAPACLTDIHWATQSAWYVLGQYNTNCIPHGSGSSLPNPTLSSFFSPALYCPSGFTVACSSEVASETRAVCCPQLDNVPLISRASFTCATSPPAWGAWSSYGCSLNIGTLVSQGPLTIVVDDAQGARTTSTSLTNVNEGVNAYSVQIRWHATDIAAAAAVAAAASTTMTTSSLSGPTSGSESSTQATVERSRSSTSSLSPTATSSNTVQSAENSTTAGLSTAAKVAVGVVIPVVLVGMLVAGFLIMRRKKRNGGERLASPKPSNPLPPLEAMSSTKYEMDVREHSYPQEMADTSRVHGYSLSHKT